MLTTLIKFQFLLSSLWRSKIETEIKRWPKWNLILITSYQAVKKWTKSAGPTAYFSFSYLLPSVLLVRILHHISVKRREQGCCCTNSIEKKIELTPLASDFNFFFCNLGSSLFPQNCWLLSDLFFASQNPQNSKTYKTAPTVRDSE